MGPAAGDPPAGFSATVTLGDHSSRRENAVRSERDIFNDHVGVLMRQLGVRAEEMQVPEAGRLLNEARSRRLNDHEAALSVAYGLIPRLLDRDLERCRVLLDRLALVAEAWRDDDLVARHLPAALDRAARRALRDAEG